jgi:hypothetical protein
MKVTLNKTYDMAHVFYNFSDNTTYEIGVPLGYEGIADIMVEKFFSKETDSLNFSTDIPGVLYIKK